MFKRIRFWRKKIEEKSLQKKGQTTTEYILILAVVVVIAMQFKTLIKKQLGNAIQKIGGNITKTLGP